MPSAVFLCLIPKPTGETTDNITLAVLHECETSVSFKRRPQVKGVGEKIAEENV